MSMLDAFTSLREVPPEARAGLAARLEEYLRLASTAHPEPALEPDRFAARLAQVLAQNDEPLAALELVRPAAIYLSLAWALHDPHALATLERDHLPRIASFVARVDRSPAFADEVAQRLRAHLLVAGPDRAPGILDYSGRGDLDGFLRVLALRFAQRLKRQEQKAGSALAQHELPELFGGADPERDHLKLRYRGEYQHALKSALDSLSVRERLFLRLHYADGLNIDAIGRLYQMHRSTVARRLAEHRRRVLERTRAELRARLALSDSDFESVLAAVRSQLVVSLGET